MCLRRERLSTASSLNPARLEVAAVTNRRIFEGGLSDPPAPISSGDTRYNKTGGWRYLRPVSEEKLAPCRHACPAGTDIPRVLSLLASGRLEEAYQKIIEENPLPGVCGRVCYHPCELACNRQAFDQPAAIQAAERFLADTCENGAPVPLPHGARPERVAIVGSGPAGLSCAWFLARGGFKVTVFEADREAGGMLRSGIPPYRLPRAALDREIDRFVRMGVTFRLNCRVGGEVSTSSLGRCFDAIFVATGAHRSTPLGIPGEESPAVLSGLDFLKRLNAGDPMGLGREVLVVGGGNTAIDAARAAIRLGSRATVAYRRARGDMPAVPDEIAEAEVEGVEFLFQAAPKRILRHRHHLSVELVKTTPGVPDASGRPLPVEAPGSQFQLRFHSILTAIGESPDLGGLAENPQAAREELSALGCLLGGDAATGPRSVVEAIASGKRAAREIMARFGLKHPASSEGAAKPIPFRDLNTAYFAPLRRAKPPRQSARSRIEDFTEVVGGITREQALAEATRCFSCGVCNACDNCWVFCPEGAVTRLDGQYKIDLDFCKGCGICARECPRGVVSLHEEEP